MVNTYGYARVSTAGQSLDEQLQSLSDAGVAESNIFAEKFTGTTTDRPQFNELMKHLKPNDTLVVTKLDRFARNTREALDIIDPLLEQNTVIRVLNLGTIENTPMGKMIVRTLLSVAEMERDMIVERTQAGKKYAKKNNPNFREGRPKRKIGAHERAVYEFTGTHTISQTVDAFNISRSTVFRIKRQIENNMKPIVK